MLIFDNRGELLLQHKNEEYKTFTQNNYHYWLDKVRSMTLHKMLTLWDSFPYAIILQEQVLNTFQLGLPDVACSYNNRPFQFIFGENSRWLKNQGISPIQQLELITLSNGFNFLVAVDDDHYYHIFRLVSALLHLPKYYELCVTENLVTDICEI